MYLFLLFIFAGELGRPEEYLEIFSRKRVWEYKYGGSVLSRDPFELTGSLDDKGKKMLLLHLMHNVIYDDSRRYLLNQVSSRCHRRWTLEVRTRRIKR